MQTRCSIRSRLFRLPILRPVMIVALLTTTVAVGAEKPNILFIAIDDQNDWIGCLGGHPQVQTPHIDRLAASGTLFTNAHCQSPLCNLVPDQSDDRAAAVDDRHLWAGSLVSRCAELAEVVSLPQYLRKHGYRTLSGGKIYHGGYSRRKGDNELDDLGPPSGVGIRPPEKLVQTPQNHALVDWGVFPHEDEDKGDWQVASWGVEQLARDQDQPFFLSVGFFLPHVPCYATQKWFDLYPEETLQLPPVRLDDRDDTPRFSWYLHWKLPEPRYRVSGGSEPVEESGALLSGLYQLRRQPGGARDEGS